MRTYRKRPPEPPRTEAEPYVPGNDYSQFGRILTDNAAGEEYFWQPGRQLQGPVRSGDYLVRDGGNVLVIPKDVFEAEWEQVPDTEPGRVTERTA